MTGKYDIDVYNKRVRYRITVKRNITILRGNSATGKSELIRLLTAYNNNPRSSGITVICEKNCEVLTDGNWKLYLHTYADRIFFVDEGNNFLRTQEFAENVKGSDNYFVIISRESLPQLPYSIEEIYGLRDGNKDGRYRIPQKVYNEMYQLYGTFSGKGIQPEWVISEDSNSGYEFFRLLFAGRCISAQGKGNIKRMLMEHEHSPVIAIVDGAAFGPQMQECIETIVSLRQDAAIYAPESFEYILLKSGIVEVQKVVLEETWNHADSKLYFSWEEFYTSHLSEITRNKVSQYSKRKLNEFYKTKGNVERIKRILPEEVYGPVKD